MKQILKTLLNKHCNSSTKTKKKGIKGNVVFGKFFKHVGTHITLWMDSERKPRSAKSIKNFVGKKGEFKPRGVQFLMIGNSYCKS